MSGSAKRPPNGTCPDEWFDLVDLATDQVVGHITRNGQVRHADPDVAERVNAAFDREIMLRNEAIANELGICFADVETVTPDDGRHHELVFRNLGLLTGLVPQQSNAPGTRQPS